MKSYEGMPEKDLPPQEPPIEIFVPLTEAQAGKTESTGFMLNIDHYPIFQQLAVIDGTNVMDQHRGAVEAMLYLIYEPSTYYDFQIFDEVPDGEGAIYRSGRLPMSQLWQLAKLSRYGTEGWRERRDLIIYSANSLYIDQRLMNKFTFGAVKKGLEERQSLLPPPRKTTITTEDLD